jgi:hypothetical protein
MTTWPVRTARLFGPSALTGIGGRVETSGSSPSP